MESGQKCLSGSIEMTGRQIPTYPLSPAYIEQDESSLNLRTVILSCNGRLFLYSFKVQRRVRITGIWTE